jgi:hypothetical protein
MCSYGDSIPERVDRAVKEAFAAQTDILLARLTPELAKETTALDTPYAACRVFKATQERRFTLGLAYPAMKADVARASDGFRDFVTPDVLAKTAHRWLHEYRDVNLFHQGGTSGHFTPAESYLWPEGAPQWDVKGDGSVLIKENDWLLGGYWDEYGWSLVKAGLVNGWSPEGTAARREALAEHLALLR